MVVKLCFAKVCFVWICFSTLESLQIKDYFIRGFCKDKMGGFRGLKGYAMASEDRELEAKLAVVENTTNAFQSWLNGSMIAPRKAQFGQVSETKD